MAFAETAELDQLFLCSCAEDSVRNAIALRQELFANERYSDASVMAPLSSHLFPDNLAKRSLAEGNAAARFRDRLCHRCNLAVPELTWCASMYGGQFMQTYGWYIQQNYYRLGVMPGRYTYLDSVCPESFKKQIAEINKARLDYQSELNHLNQMVRGPQRDDIAADEITYWYNVKLEEAKPYEAARKRYEQLCRRFANQFENMTRNEFGHRKIGEGWVSETLLYQIVCRIFSSQLVIHHDRPEWLEGLELDIHVPRERLGLEYQGQQHFHPIEAWGGIEALESVRQRDSRKSTLCKKNGLRLIRIDYTEPLTEEHIRSRLSQAADNSPGKYPRQKSH